MALLINTLSTLFWSLVGFILVGFALFGAFAAFQAVLAVIYLVIAVSS